MNTAERKKYLLNLFEYNARVMLKRIKREENSFLDTIECELVFTHDSDVIRL